VSEETSPTPAELLSSISGDELGARLQSLVEQLQKDPDLLSDLSPEEFDAIVEYVNDLAPYPLVPQLDQLLSGDGNALVNRQNWLNEVVGHLDDIVEVGEDDGEISEAVTNPPEALVEPEALAKNEIMAEVDKLITDVKNLSNLVQTLKSNVGTLDASQARDELSEAQTSLAEIIQTKSAIFGKISILDDSTQIGKEVRQKFVDQLDDLVDLIKETLAETSTNIGTEPEADPAPEEESALGVQQGLFEAKKAEIEVATNKIDAYVSEINRQVTLDGSSGSSPVPAKINRAVGVYQELVGLEELGKMAGFDQSLGKILDYIDRFVLPVKQEGFEAKEALEAQVGAMRDKVVDAQSITKDLALRIWKDGYKSLCPELDERDGSAINAGPNKSFAHQLKELGDKAPDFVGMSEDELKLAKRDLQRKRRSAEGMATSVVREKFGDNNELMAIIKDEVDSNVQGEYQEVVETLGEAIVEARRVMLETPQPDPTEEEEPVGAVENAEPMDRQSVMRELDELWLKLSKNYKAQINSPQSTGIQTSVERMRDLIKELTPAERELMEIAFKMRDAVYQESGEDASVFLAWSNKNPAAEARIKARETVDANDLRAYRHDFDNLVVLDDSENPVSINLTEIIEKIENDYFNGPCHYDPADPSKLRNYAALGNPGENDAAKIMPEDGTPIIGVPTIEQMIRRDFPETKWLPDFVIGSIDNFIIASEMRNNFYIPEYAGYQGSPIPGFDGSPSENSAPMAACLYKAQSGGAFPKHRVMATVTRLPKPEEMDLYLLQHGNQDGYYVYKGHRPSFVGGYHGKAFNIQETALGRSKAPDNIEKWIEIRNKMIAEFTATPLDYVRLRPDLKIKPTFYDWIRGSWEGSVRPLGKLTYHEFIQTEAFFVDYEKFVDSEFKSPDGTKDVDTAISLMVDKIRDFKLLLDPRVRMEDDKQIFLKVVQLMAIVCLKKVFIAFSKHLLKERQQAPGDRWTKRSGYQLALTQFHEIADKILKESKTLPSCVLNDGDFALSKVMEDIGLPLGMAEFKHWGKFFTNDVEAQSEEFNRKVERRIEPPFMKEYQNWMRDPTLKEEETGH
jgi:hypothetical protein